MKKWVWMIVVLCAVYVVAQWAKAGEGPQANIGKGAYNSVNGARRGQIVGVEERFGATVYGLRTDEGATSYAPLDGTEAR